MIDRINNGNYTNPYSNRVNKTSATGQDVPPFLLDFEEEGVFYERGETKKEEAAPKKISTGKDSYETSINKQIEAEKPKNDTSSSLDFAAILDKALNAVKSFFVGVFEFIWYGDDKPSDKQEEITEENMSVDEAVISEEKNDENVKILSLRKEREEEYRKKVELAKQGVKGIPARNTSLLTTYDRWGHINKPSATDSVLILKGDKSLKL